MVVVFDIGNTNVHYGLYDGDTLLKKGAYPVADSLFDAKIKKLMVKRKIEGAGIASVVPGLTTKIEHLVKEYLNTKIVIVDSTLQYPIRFYYHEPETIGSDRIANVVGGLSKYKTNLIVISFGTATTFDVVLKNGDYLGGVITIGIRTSMDALAEHTALLMRVPLVKSAPIIGRSTQECIQSGALHGTVAMVKGLIQNISRDCKKKFLCIATGGLSTIIAPYIKEIKYCEPDLCLFGVLKIYQNNVLQKTAR